MADKQKLPTDRGLEIGLLISALLALLDFAEPRIKEAQENGDITPEDQQKLKDKIDSLRDGAGFSDPEWQPSSSQSSPS